MTASDLGSAVMLTPAVCGVPLVHSSTAWQGHGPVLDLRQAGTSRHRLRIRRLVGKGVGANGRTEPWINSPS